MSCWVTVEGKKNVELSRLRLRQPECDGQARDPPCLDILRRISRAMAIVRHRHAIRSRDRGPPVVGISDGWILRSPPASGLVRYNPVWTIDTDKMIYNRSLELQY